MPASRPSAIAASTLSRVSLLPGEPITTVGPGTGEQGLVVRRVPVQELGQHRRRGGPVRNVADRRHDRRAAAARRPVPTSPGRSVPPDDGPGGTVHDIEMVALPDRDAGTVRGHVQQVHRPGHGGQVDRRHAGRDVARADRGQVERRHAAVLVADDQLERRLVDREGGDAGRRDGRDQRPRLEVVGRGSRCRSRYAAARRRGRRGRPGRSAAARRPRRPPARRDRSWP